MAGLDANKLSGGGNAVNRLGAGNGSAVARTLTACYTPLSVLFVGGEYVTSG